MFVGRWFLRGAGHDPEEADLDLVCPTSMLLVFLLESGLRPCLVTTLHAGISFLHAFFPLSVLA